MNRLEFVRKINIEFGLPYHEGIRLGDKISYDYEKARMMLIPNCNELELEQSIRDADRAMDRYNAPFCSKDKSDIHPVEICCPCCNSVFYTKVSGPTAG